MFLGHWQLGNTCGGLHWVAVFIMDIISSTFGGNVLHASVSGWGARFVHGRVHGSYRE